MTDTELVVQGSEVEVVVEASTYKPVVDGAATELVVEAGTAGSVAVDKASMELVAEVQRYSVVVEGWAPVPGSPTDDDLSLTYDGSGRLSSVVFDDGEVLALSYGADGLGQVTSNRETDPVATLTYAGGRLDRVVYGLD